MKSWENVFQIPLTTLLGFTAFLGSGADNNRSSVAAPEKDADCLETRAKKMKKMRRLAMEKMQDRVLFAADFGMAIDSFDVPAAADGFNAETAFVSLNVTGAPTAAADQVDDVTVDGPPLDKGSKSSRQIDTGR